jgi:hypothetical protein
MLRTDCRTEVQKTAATALSPRCRVMVAWTRWAHEGDKKQADSTQFEGGIGKPAP